LPRYYFPNLSILTSILESLAQLIRKMKWKFHFAQTPQRNSGPNFIPKIDRNTSLPDYYDEGMQLVDKYAETCKTNLSTLQLITPLKPIDKTILSALKALRQRTDIVIKPADKNLGTVIMTKAMYNNMCMEHLRDDKTYRKLSNVEINEFTNESYNNLIAILDSHGQYKVKKRAADDHPTRLTALAKSLLQLRNTSHLRIANFYCLPKMHKSPVAGRPIVGSIDTITYHTSKFLHNFLFPMVARLSSVCTSSSVVVYDLHTMNNLPDGCCIVCADVKSLYPSIPIQYGLRAVDAVAHMLQYRLPEIPLVMQLLRWTLENNFLSFENEVYQQIAGTAMGTPVAVSYANIVLYFLEMPCLDMQPLYYRRFIDDLFIIAASQAQGQSIVDRFNLACPAIQLDAVTIGNKGIFLDLAITITNNRASVTLYQKDMNKYLYIPPTSYHSDVLKKNIIWNEIRRYRLNCESDVDFNAACAQYKSRLSLRGYSLFYLNPIFSYRPKREDLLRELGSQLAQKREPSAPAKLHGPIITVSLPNKPQCSLQAALKMPRELREHGLYKIAYGDNDIIIGKRNSRSIGAYLTHKPTKKEDVPDTSALGPSTGGDQPPVGGTRSPVRASASHGADILPCSSFTQNSRKRRRLDQKF